LGGLKPPRPAAPNNTTTRGRHPAALLPARARTAQQAEPAEHQAEQAGMDVRALFRAALAVAARPLRGAPADGASAATAPGSGHRPAAAAVRDLQGASPGGAGHGSASQQPPYALPLLAAAIVAISSAAAGFRLLPAVPAVAAAAWRLQLTSVLLAALALPQWRELSDEQRARVRGEAPWLVGAQRRWAMGGHRGCCCSACLAPTRL
jgi:hypothetical protein